MREAESTTTEKIIPKEKSKINRLVDVVVKKGLDDISNMRYAVSFTILKIYLFAPLIFCNPKITNCLK